MGKKMKLPFLSRTTSSDAKLSSWTWPSCNLQPRTLSFRTPDDVLKTMNTTYLDSSTVETNELRYRKHSMEQEHPSLSTLSEDQADDPVEMVIRGLRSDRLFFEPGETSSILQEDNNMVKTADESSDMPFKESTVVMAMDSQDPYADFRKSMEEMVEAYGLKDWKSLEELLFWYLRVNEKNNHEYILGAFVDLLVGISFTSSSTSCNPPVVSSSSSYSPCSPWSFYTSSSSLSSSTTTPCVSSLRVEEDIDLSCSCLSSPLEVEKKIVEVKDDDDAS